MRELRGFSSPYVGSEPGRIVKGGKKAGSLKTVFQLDELDKIKSEVATELLDLLDREFTDSFLDVPVDFSKSIFIATANEWGNVPAVIRDRFIVANVDGYSREEKAEIVSDYIIPKIENGYAASSVSVSIEDSARTYLLEAYCTSFGVRDAEKAMQRIVSSKLLEQVGKENSTIVNINKDDVRRCLGEEPIPRGNFPEDGNQPGISKALAVSNGNMGSTFAIETVLVGGDETLEMTGLPKESATDSVKIAVTCIKKMFTLLYLNNREKWDQMIQKQKDRLKYLDYMDENFIVTHPTTIAEIFQEGISQNNCLLRMFEEISQGNRDIGYMRFADRPEQSLITFEVCDGKVCQLLAKNNVMLKHESLEFQWFTNIYLKEKGLILS